MKLEMIFAIAIAAYCVGVWFLIRFFQAVHQWDEEIEAMEEEKKRQRRY